MRMNTVTCRSTLMALACGLALSAHAMADAPQRVDLPAGDLTLALQKLAEQSGVEFIYSTEQLKAFHTEGLHGEYAAKDAIQLLLKGTGLEVREGPNGAILIAAPKEKAPSDSSRSTRSQRSENDAGRFRLAQEAQASTATDASVEKQETEHASQQKSVQLEEIVVTGSRIAGAEVAAPNVIVLDQKMIEQTGAANVQSLFYYLPQAGMQSDASGQGGGGPSAAYGIRLRGLSFGTTLVLLNGRRIVTSGAEATGGFFDLNNIPIAAIDRIEILTDSASAVYGADALAGVVNIILKKDIERPTVGAQFSDIPGTAAHDTQISLSDGFKTSSVRGSLLVTAEHQGELLISERDPSSNADFRRFGGSDDRETWDNPGNIYSLTGGNLPGLNAGFAAVPHGSGIGLTPADFQNTAGTLNRHTGDSDLRPDARRYGALGTIEWAISNSLSAFGELMYSDSKQIYSSADPALTGGSFGLYRVSAANPFNPFGVPVGVDYVFSALGPVRTDSDTNFGRILMGLRGSAGSDWEWESAALVTREHSDFSTVGQIDP
jgi:iron complex outermembrane recepter protein